MAHSTDIVAYDYQSDRYTPKAILVILNDHGLASAYARFVGPEDTEETLDEIASANAIDRYAENTYDTDEFPKVVFRDQLQELDSYDTINDIDENGNLISINIGDM